MRLIDADALPKYTGYALSADEVAKAVENAPTIEAEPARRGRWLTEYGDHIHAGLRPVFICCSECGMVTAVEWHYCPNCGARMEEQEGD